MFRLFLVPFLLILLLEGCASSPKTSLPKQTTQISTDSLRASFSMEFQNGEGSWQQFSAVLFSVPGKRYRIELSGPMGIGVASLLWTDSLWSIIFPTERSYLQGNGYLVGVIGSSDFPLVNIHQVASFFEQKTLPDSYQEISVIDSASGKIIKALDGAGMNFSFYPEQEKVLWLEKGSERIWFRWPEILVQKNGNDYLKIKVKKVRQDVTWNASIWRLSIPVTYTKI